MVPLTRLRAPRTSMVPVAQSTSHRTGVSPAYIIPHTVPNSPYSPDERVCGNQHFIAWTETRSDCRKMQRRGARGDADCVTHRANLPSPLRKPHKRGLDNRRYQRVGGF